MTAFASRPISVKVTRCPGRGFGFQVSVRLVP